jgi:inhibitor of KinA sporulation pathway (predicted exonuclease)
MKGNPQHPKQTGTEHNALEDARWNKQLYDFLMSK